MKGSKEQSGNYFVWQLPHIVFLCNLLGNMDKHNWPWNVRKSQQVAYEDFVKTLNKTPGPFHDLNIDTSKWRAVAVKVKEIRTLGRKIADTVESLGIDDFDPANPLIMNLLDIGEDFKIANKYLGDMFSDMEIYGFKLDILNSAYYIHSEDNRIDTDEPVHTKAATLQIKKENESVSFQYMVLLNKINKIIL